MMRLGVSITCRQDTEDMYAGRRDGRMKGMGNIMPFVGSAASELPNVNKTREFGGEGGGP